MRYYIQMGILLLLILLAVYVIVDAVRDYFTQKRERERRDARANLRRQYLAKSPDSPAAYEMLGDALREADEPRESVTCYEKALALAAERGAGVASGAGWMAGSGLETKLRLARLEVSEKSDPGMHGQTNRTRQQVCRSCGFLGQPADRDCSQCGAPLPVDTMLDAWRHDTMRRSIVGESIQAAVMATIVVACLFAASWMSIEERGCIAIAAVIVIPIRLLKKLGGS